jgi:DNA repair ATPase RecN
MSELIKNEVNIMNALNDFNKKYADYTRCNYQIPGVLTTIGNCSTTLNEITTSYDTVNSEIEKMNTDLLNVNNKVDQAKYKEDHDKIVANYKEVLKLRNNIDTQLKELYRVKYSSSAEYQKDLDRSVYINLFLTILITSVAYFTFLKLK